MTYRELLHAVSEGDVGRVRRMLHPDTDLNRAPGTTPLYRAAVNGDHEMVRLLLEYGADPDQPSGGTDEGLPLCGAACWNHWETIQALVDGGADPNAREGGGWTALLWAAAQGHLMSADVLLDAGADPDAADDEDTTPLTAAARFGAYGVVWSLLEHGADPARADGACDTALSIARRWAGTDLEAEMREEVARHAEPGWAVMVARSHADDGTELITVEARDARGDGFQATRQRGHAAITILLEEALGLRTPAEDLVARAVPYREVDEDGETWWAAVHALQKRHDDETFEAAAELCDSGDATDREFAVDVLAQFGYDAGVRPFHERSLAILRRLARTETEPKVVDALLGAIAHHGDAEALPEVLEIVDRPGRRPSMSDAIALAAVLPPDDEEGLSRLVRLSEEGDTEVRDWATMGLAGLDADTPRIREALAARLADGDITTVAEAVRGLAARGDRRAIGGIHRVLSETDDDYARDLALDGAAQLGLDIETVIR
ncbi:ankyrin repeat domain-containing protein [Microtetraspora sp. AC03309]|uniref:ankyrin repeat domain-containing protein n=1 Tax=Microtetraspora sp. AC03309 TaxID=2779376 RepID=UPI001E49A5F1|nr:ankyrin repeat domain-containing protein [Microtetraspora sp. AC03309]